MNDAKFDVIKVTKENRINQKVERLNYNQLDLFLAKTFIYTD